MSHRGDLDTSTSAPQILAPSPSRSRTWRPLRSGGRPVLTPERDAARATPRPESPRAASCGQTHQSKNIVRPKAAHLLGGLADIAVVDVSQEAPITTRAHHCIIQSTVSGLLTRPSSTWTRRQFGKCASLTLLVAPRITKCDSPKWSDVGWRLRPSSLMLRRSMILTRRSRLVAY